MITASFLVKDLHVDWARGARHGDTDAAPYHRIFNPSRQSATFDPGGAYIRRWVPELAHIDGRHVHAPWTAPGGPPPGYPPPIVDHDTERKEALARYQDVRGR